MSPSGPFVSPSDLPGYEEDVAPIETESRVTGHPASKWDWEKALITRSRSEGIKPTWQHVALLLSVYADGDGTSIRPSIATLVDVSGRSKATVQESLKNLRDRGWVQQVSRGSGLTGQTSEYRLTIPPKVQ